MSMNIINLNNRIIGDKRLAQKSHVLAHFYKALGQYARDHNIIPAEYAPVIDINTVKFPIGAGPILARDPYLWERAYLTKDGYVIYTKTQKANL